MFNTTVIKEATINNTNMLGLGKNKQNDFSILDSHFYEPISIIKSE